MICDFCSAPEPRWRHPALSFIASHQNEAYSASFGDWSACDACHGLIEAGDRGGLARRSLDELIMLHPEAILETDLLLLSLSELHEQFFDNQSSPSSLLS